MRSAISSKKSSNDNELIWSAQTKHIKSDEAVTDLERRINELMKEIDDVTAHRVDVDDKLSAVNKQAEVLRGVAQQVANGSKTDQGV